MVWKTLIPATEEAEAGGLQVWGKPRLYLCVQGQPVQFSKMLSQNKNEKELGL